MCLNATTHGRNAARSAGLRLAGVSTTPITRAYQLTALTHMNVTNAPHPADRQNRKRETLAHTLTLLRTAAAAKRHPGGGGRAWDVVGFQRWLQPPGSLLLDLVLRGALTAISIALGALGLPAPRSPQPGALKFNANPACSLLACGPR